jgi:hypothetical protein
MTAPSGRKRGASSTPVHCRRVRKIVADSDEHDSTDSDNKSVMQTEGETEGGIQDKDSEDEGDTDLDMSYEYTKSLADADHKVWLSNRNVIKFFIDFCCRLFVIVLKQNAPLTLAPYSKKLTTSSMLIPEKL